MKTFQFLISSCFRNPTGLSLKSLTNGSLYKINNASKYYIGTNFLHYHTAAVFLNVNKLRTMCYSTKEVHCLSTPQSKKRIQRKKIQKWKENLNGKTCSAVAYCSAEGYKMQHLIQGLENQGLFKCLPLPEDAGEDLHLCVKDESIEEPSHIYIFSEGSIVFWNISALQQREMLYFLRPYEVNSYDPASVNDEKEDLDYTYSEDETNLVDGCIILNSKNNTGLSTYTFSNSLSQSVKLGILEDALEKYSSSLEWVTDKMKKGEKIKMSRSEIFAKRGELFYLRHAINLSSDLLDTPDFYWDRKDLEILYHKTCNYLDIPQRIRTLNVRLNYCSELVDLLVNHMNDEHHVRLEWMIIILIMVEVVFECVHFLQMFSH